MTTTRAPIRPALLLTVVALVAAACGGGGSDDQVSSRGTTSSSTSSSSTTTTAPDDPGAAAPGAGGSPTGDTATGGDAGAGGSDAGGSGGSDAGPPANDQGAVQPLAAGLYRYATDGESRGPSGAEPMPEETTLEASAPEGARQRTVRDLRDGSGDGSVTTVDVAYRDDGVYLERLKVVNSSNFGTFTFEFVFDPPELVLPVDAEGGFHTEFTARSTDGGIDADITIDVTGEETLTVGGTSVDTLTTRTVTRFSGAFSGESTWNDNVDPEHFLIVREDRVSEVRFGVSKFSNEYVATLQGLRPE